MNYKDSKKSDYVCPRCGGVLYHEKLGTTRDNYPFVCPECDENFFEFEILLAEATIGYSTIDAYRKVVYHGGQTDNGVCYKDLEAWKTGKGVVYISEYGLDARPQETWTRESLLAFLRMDLYERGVYVKDADLVAIAEDLLDNAEWQDLSTLWYERIYNEDYSNMKYLVTHYYLGSISKIVEAASKQEANSKLDYYVETMSREEFLTELELCYSDSDCVSEEDEQSIANKEVEL